MFSRKIAISIDAIDKVGITRTGRRNNEDSLSHFRQLLRFQTVSDVSGYPSQIGHPLLGRFEDMAVDLLMNRANVHGSLSIGGGVSFVKVADFTRFRVENFAVDLEFVRNLSELLFSVNGHSARGIPLARQDGVTAHYSKCREYSSNHVSVLKTLAGWVLGSRQDRVLMI
ncbi:MAG: hypothetical protein M2R45_03981 [Verrucomicrobia subdivision 3 bacterium]|nr:hypothetical protein [Limisphaerales bacterium]MCS1415499.1 hypothetical protein [Limisphaerales bacterium]